MMSSILAIEPDRRQAARLSGLARGPISADIAVVASVDQALAAIAATVPDLILTPLLLSPRDDAALTARLRELAADGAAVQTLVIPVLATSGGDDADRGSGLLNRLRRPRTGAQPDGCDPMVFAAQVNAYLERIAVERHERAEAAAKERAQAAPKVLASAPMLEELLPAMPSPGRYAPFGRGASFGSDDLWRTVAVVPVAPHSTVEQPPAPSVEPFDRVHEPVPEIELALGTEGVCTEAEVTEPAPAQFETFPETDELERFNLVRSIRLQADVGAPAEAGAYVHLESALGMDPRAADDGVELWMPLAAWHDWMMAPIEGPVVRLRPVASSDGPVAPRPRAVIAPVATIAKTKPARVRPRPQRQRPDAKPIQDEWGLYDPAQCGFAALLERLDQALEAEADTKAEGDRSVIIRR